MSESPEQYSYRTSRDRPGLVRKPNLVVSSECPKLMASPTIFLGGGGGIGIQLGYLLYLIPKIKL